MKKLWILFLSLFAVVGIVSCNNDDPTEIEYNLNEQLEVPSNLSVNETTKTLTWDAVENAVRYNVYVDGELEDEVTTTSFNFSGITGDKLVFTVKAMAPKGMQNSDVSTTIAYVANRESEIAQMKLSIQASIMTVNDEDAFATELVNKGMLSEDFDTMMNEMEDMEAVLDMNDMSDIYNQFDQLIATMDMAMIEAFISSLIKVELRTLIQSELDSYQSAPTNTSMEEAKEQLEDLLDFIDDKGDEAVKSAMIVIEYLVTVQNGIETELVNNVETLMDSTELTSANISMLVNVKNDLVTNLKENLPELQDVIVLNSTLVAFIQVTGEDTMDTSIISIPKQSAQSLMSMELFFNFVLEMDEDYMGALFEAENAFTPEDTKPFVKENIRLINQYLENNDILIQQLNNIYTDEEKETMFYDYYIELAMGSFYDVMLGYMYSNASMSEDISTIIEEQIDFDNILILQNSMGDTFNELLDAIIASDYAVIDAFYQVAALSGTSDIIENDDFGGSLDFGIITELQPGEYRVIVRGLSSYEEGPYDFYIYADYGDGEELIQSSSDVLVANDENEYTFTLTETAIVHTYTVSDLDTFGTLEKIQDDSQDQMTEAEAVANLMKESLALINPILQDVTVEEYTAMIDLMFVPLMIQYEMQAAFDEYNEYNDYTEMLSIIGYIETGVKNTAINQLNIIKDFVDLLDQTDYIDEIVELRGSENDEYGTEEYWGSIIILANAYLDFYNDSQNDIDTIIDEVMTVLNEEDVRNELGLTSTDLEDMEIAINSYFTDLTDLANLVKDYDYMNLTSIQQANLDAFMTAMFGIMFMI